MLSIIKNILFKSKRLNPCVIWLTGLPKSGKSTIAKELKKIIQKKGNQVIIIEDEEVKRIFPRGLPDDEIAYIASLLEMSGIVVIVSTKSYSNYGKDCARELCSKMYDVFINTPYEVCKKRDSIGVFKQKAIHEIPENFDIDIKTSGFTPDRNAFQIITAIMAKQNCKNC